jgi:hypothetical protein
MATLHGRVIVALNLSRIEILQPGGGGGLDTLEEPPTAAPDEVAGPTVTNFNEWAPTICRSIGQEHASIERIQRPPLFISASAAVECSLGRVLVGIVECRGDPRWASEVHI